MTVTNNEEVKEFVERVEITPSGSNDDNEDETEEKETLDESSESKEPEEEETDSEEESDEGTESETAVTSPKKGKEANDLKDVPNETPRERALRLEVTRLKRERSQERAGELIGQPKVHQVQREMSPEKKELLSKYKPEELAALREVIPVLAEEMGLVREDQLQVKEVVKESNTIFEQFMGEHPEYGEENDPDGTLWNALKEEYALYEKPKDPKQLKKILERAHKEVFGIQPAGALKTVKAAEEKIKVASHGSNSKPQVSPRREEGLVTKPGNVRMDMLKGFSEDDLASMGIE